MAQIKKLSTELQPLDKLLDTSGDAGTSGQILSTTGSGTNWIDNTGGGGTVTGTGADQQVTYWTGSSVIDGDAGFKYNKSSGGYAAVTLSSASAPQLCFKETGSAYTESMRLLRDSDKLKFTYGDNANEEAMTIVGGTGSNVGYVGIGTNSPTQLLTISGDSKYIAHFDGSNYAFMLGADSSGDGNFELFNSSGTKVIKIYAEANAANYINNGGNVGIGTSTPTYKLQVVSADASDDVAYIHHDNASQSSGTLLKIRTDAGDSNGYTLLDVQTNTGSALFVRGDRNTGIKTSSPIHPLYVNGDIGQADGFRIWFRGSSSSSGTGSQSYIYSDGLNLKIKGDDNVRILGDGGGTIAHFDYSGKVGIGTLAPSELLQVAGNIRASGSYKVGATDVITSGRRFYAAAATGPSSPAYSFSGKTDTGMYRDDAGSDDRLNFAVDGSRRVYIDSNGLTSQNSVYVSSQFRNYGDIWRGTTGTTGNGFQFYNTADNSSAVLLSITSVASAATDSVATFSGKVVSAQTASSDGNGVLTTKSYVDGLVTGVTRYMGLWDASSGTGGNPDLTASTYKVPGYYFIVSVGGTAEPNGAGTEPDTWHVGDWVIWSDQATDAWQKIDNTSVLSGTGTANKVAMWNGDESLTNAPITISSNDSTFAGNVDLPDNKKVQLGDNQDLKLYHDGSHSIIQDSGTGVLKIITSGVTFQNETASANTLVLDSSGNGTFAGYVAATQFRPTNIVTNKVVKFNGTQLDDSSITDTGSLVTFSTSLTGTNATFTAGTATSGTPLTLGSNTQTSYTLQQFQTSAHGTNNAYLIAYGAGHGSQAGNFAMKNTLSGKNIFFEVNNAVPLKLENGTSTFTGKVRINATTTTGLEIASSSGATSGLKLFNNSSTDTASIINHYNGDLLIGTNNAAVLTMNGTTSTFAGDIATSSGKLNITSDGSAANGAEIYLKHANNNTTDTIGTIIFGNNADSTLSTIVSETNGANNTSNLKFRTSNAGTIGTALTLNADNSATFAGSISFTGGLSMTDSILIDYTGSDGQGIDAGVKVMNDASDWGMYIRKDSSADYGMRIDSGGANAFNIYSTTGGSTKSFGVNGGTGATSITGTESLMLTLNPTANNYGGIWFKYGGTSKGMSVYNSGNMVYGGESGVGTILQTNGQHALNIDTSQNATFAGEVTLNGTDGHINLDGNNAVIFDNSNNNNAWYIRNGGSNAATLQMGTGSSPGSNIKLTLDGSGNAAFAGSIVMGGATLANGYMIEMIPTGGNILRSTRGTSVFGSYQSTDGPAYFGTTSSDDFVLITNDVARLTLSAAGNATFANDVIIEGQLQFNSNDGATCSKVDWLTYLCPDTGTSVNSKIGYLETNFPDNSKVTFGDATNGDLQIYHDGSNSYIKENGTGVLYIQGSSNVQIEGINGENMIICNENGSVQLHYNHDQKFQTTSTGVQVAGNIVLSGNESSIILDHTLSSNGESGILTTIGTGMFSTGDVMYLASGGGWSQAVATSAAAATSMLSVAGAGSPSGGMVLQGIIYMGSHGFTIGAPLYLSTTSGDFTNTAPSSSGQYVRILGYAIDANHIYFDPDKTWVLIS